VFDGVKANQLPYSSAGKIMCFLRIWNKKRTTMTAHHLTSLERRGVVSLSFIMSLRMIGLFMVLPVFSLYAEQLKGATPALVGLAMGIYGLSQALLQIPFGSLSDRYGRKPIILIGLIIFSIGSLIAGSAHTITAMVIGRALQGAGAVGGTILAMMADLTREEQRTKAMAIAGMTIGASFMLAMLIGPILTAWFTVSGLFYVAMIMGLATIIILYTWVPTPAVSVWHRDAEPSKADLIALLLSPELAKFNIGIFILHAIFTACFMVIPIELSQFAGISLHTQWQLYLPALIVAFAASLICIGLAEKRQQVKRYFLGGIATLILAECMLWLSGAHLLFAKLGLVLFMTGFSLMEAFLPSLVSRAAPAARKGSAMGLFSCAQFSGIFVGGALGGWLFGQFSFTGVYLFCLLLSFFWFALALIMQPPRYLVTRTLCIQNNQQWSSITAALQAIPGIAEVTYIAEERIAYLKMERDAAKNPDFIRLQEQLQSE
jgi:MFS family permease